LGSGCWLTSSPNNRSALYQDYHDHAVVTEALLAAVTTWLMIRAGRPVTNDAFLARDLIWISSLSRHLISLAR
jgi:hypothetical protein